MRKSVLNKIYKQIASGLDISSDVVEQVYNTYWKTIKNIILKLKIAPDTSEEYFSQNKTNFNLIGLGKLRCTYNTLNKAINKQKHIKYDKDKESDSTI